MPAFLLSPLTRWLAVGVVVLLLGAAWRVEAARRESADLRAAAAEAAVQGRDKAIAALERQATDAAERAARIQSVRRAVDAAPVTTACVDSPAIRAVLRGLRDAPADLGGAADAARVPSAAGAARSPR